MGGNDGRLGVVRAMVRLQGRKIDRAVGVAIQDEERPWRQQSARQGKRPGGATQLFLL